MPVGTYGNTITGLPSSGSVTWDGTTYDSDTWGVPNSTVRSPQTIGTGGGVRVTTDPLDKILQTVLSGMAVVTGRNYVPTELQPQQGISANGQGGLDPTTLALLLRQQQTGGGGKNISGQLQQVLEQHPMAVAGGAILLLFLFMKPPGGGGARRY